MTPNLATTNLLLGIMAAVSLLEALAVIGLFVGGFLIYRRIVRVIDGIEQRQVAPAAARVNAILEDVKGVTATVKAEVEYIEGIVHRITDRWRPRGRPPSGRA